MDVNNQIVNVRHTKSYYGTVNYSSNYVPATPRHIFIDGVLCYEYKNYFTAQYSWSGSKENVNGDVAAITCIVCCNNNMRTTFIYKDGWYRCVSCEMREANRQGKLFIDT